MDDKAFVKRGIKHQIKVQYFEALLEDIGAEQYRQIVNEALDELTEKKTEGAKAVPDTIEFPKPGPFEEPLSMKPDLPKSRPPLTEEEKKEGQRILSEAVANDIRTFERQWERLYEPADKARLTEQITLFRQASEALKRGDMEAVIKSVTKAEETTARYMPLFRSCGWEARPQEHG
jgi:hypothetical protein